MLVRRSTNVLLYGALLVTIVVAAATLLRSNGRGDTPVADAGETSVDTVGDNPQVEEAPAATGEDSLPEVEPRVMLFDGPVFESIEKLADEAELVVQATVGPLLSRQIDYGGQEDTSGGGLPLMFYEVTIERVLSGDAGSGDTIVLALLDDELVISDQTVKLSERDVVVLYLRRETALTAPGVDLPSGDHFYMPLGLANGLLRVDGTEVVATGQFPVAALDVDAQAIVEERGRDEAAGRVVEPIPARMPLSVIG